MESFRGGLILQASWILINVRSDARHLEGRKESGDA